MPVQSATRLETLSDWFRADSKTRESGVNACLERIKSEDPSIHAWVQVLPEKPTGEGKLSGIPFAAKDVIETRGLATEYGSPLYKGRVGTADAQIIQDLRRRGAILLGKTHTAAFAMRDPAPTRNPRNLNHTPGGSSSGSAAAVAAGMVPFALGTQTAGSVLRPASYCGVTGFKPTFGVVPLKGVLQYSKSVDTLGFFTPAVSDVLLLWDALGHDTGRDEDITFGVPDPMPKVEPAMAEAFGKAVSSLTRAGISSRPVDISGMLEQLFDAHHIVSTYEGARFHEQRWKEYGDRLGYAAKLVQEGLAISTADYDNARLFISKAGARMKENFRATPVILVPAATGPAPEGLSYTGDAKMNAPWTALGTPAISIPMPVGDALPLGLQLVAAPGEDARVLRSAVRADRILTQKS